MSVAAAATALSTYLLKDVIDAAYEDRNFKTILWLSIAIAVIFSIRGAATYGHSVNLQRIANAILARNQRQLFAKLMRENVGFFSDRAFLGIADADVDGRHRDRAGPQSRRSPRSAAMP